MPFLALIFALTHLHHLVTAFAQRPSLTSIFPVWPFLWKNKIILKKWCQPSIFTMVCNFYIYALVYACVHMRATGLVWRWKTSCELPFSYLVDPGNQTQVTSLEASTFTCWATLPVHYTVSYCFETKSLSPWLTCNTEIHLPQPRVKGMHYHIKSSMHLSLETRCSE